MRMTHPFHRYTAAGNTFLVLDTWKNPLSLSREEMREFVRGACDHTTGAGADGLILINQSGLAAAFRMDFYNPDGTTGMLCGNGARCAALAARNFGYVHSESARFEVLGAINTVEFFPNDAVRVYFQDPTVIRLNVPIPLEDKEITVSYVDLGSQHIVLFYDKRLGESGIEDFNIAHFGAMLRWHPAFAPVGANANFIEVRKDSVGKYLRIRTFERGVEGETLACGTGCMSSAIVASLTNTILKMPIRLLTQSEEFVTVSFTHDGGHVSNLSLEGNVIRGEEGILVFDEESRTVLVSYA